MELLRLEILALVAISLTSMLNGDPDDGTQSPTPSEPMSISPAPPDKKEVLTRKLRSMRRRYSSRQRELQKSKVDEAAQRLKDLIEVQMILLTHTSNAVKLDTNWNEVNDYKKFPFFKAKLEELLRKPMRRRQTRLERQLEVIDEFVEFIDDWRVEYCNDPALAEAPYEDQLVDKAKRNQAALNKWLLRLQDYVRRPESMRQVKHTSVRYKFDSMKHKDQ